MKVFILRNTVADGGKVLEAGRVVDLSKEDAEFLVRLGKARRPTPEDLKAPKRAKEGLPVRVKILDTVMASGRVLEAGEEATLPRTEAESLIRRKKAEEIPEGNKGRKGRK